MDKLDIKLMVIGFVVGYCIFMGIVLANRGVVNNQKPVVMEATQKMEPAYVAANIQVKAEPDKGTTHEAPQDIAVKGKEEVEETRAVISKATGVGRLGNKIGGLLQILAHYGIQGIVALFEAITA
ncbi:hypothetical protein SAMN03159341_105138 [Paenibacillus sp. 1_12]|uniref:hypothetical protein n=1 Tax=Paenibacillus sp. 1_12 TaxID=1566278 RepID=UPI0008DEC710|nr:hypothetical protein [Paenibacillus sp. 1_12]SFL33496.1 hypothetical protein SAMN03159341_105138 [Paenibacillus sp. 1_12]